MKKASNHTYYRMLLAIFCLVCFALLSSGCDYFNPNRKNLLGNWLWTVPADQQRVFFDTYEFLQDGTYTRTVYQVYGNTIAPFDEIGTFTVSGDNVTLIREGVYINGQKNVAAGSQENNYKMTFSQTLDKMTFSFVRSSDGEGVHLEYIKYTAQDFLEQILSKIRGKQ